MNYPAYPTYRESGVAWLGAVPEHWEVKRLKYLASINDEALPETTDPEYEFIYVDIGSVSSVEGIIKKERFCFETAPSRARRIVRAGDSIVSTVRTYLRAIATIRETNEKLIVSTGFAVIRPRQIKSGYLAYALKEKAFIENVVSRSVGVSYPAVNANEIGDISIHLPPPSEQTAIADFLDRETGRIDELIKKKRQLIELLREKRSALISRTVTRGLPADASREFGLEPHTRFRDSGIEWLGDVPEGCEMKRLSYLALLKSGENITSEQIAEGGQYPVYGGNGMRGYFSDYTHEGFFVLIGRQGALCGNINYASDRFWASEHAIVVNPLKRFSVTWLGELLRAMNLNQYSVSAAQPGLSVSQIGALKIPVPPICEQTAIATYLDMETATIDKLTSKVEQAIERLQEYRTALITAAVTGKIDVRYAAESAGRYGLAAEEGEAYG